MTLMSHLAFQNFLRLKELVGEHHKKWAESEVRTLPSARKKTRSILNLIVLKASEFLQKDKLVNFFCFRQRKKSFFIEEIFVTNEFTKGRNASSISVRYNKFL